MSTGAGGVADERGVPALGRPSWCGCGYRCGTLTFDWMSMTLRWSKSVGMSIAETRLGFPSNRGGFLLSCVRLDRSDLLVVVRRQQRRRAMPSFDVVELLAHQGTTTARAWARVRKWCRESALWGGYPHRRDVLLHNPGAALSVRAGGRSVCAGGDGAAQGAAMAVLVPGK
jgi:hypothetical protein